MKKVISFMLAAIMIVSATLGTCLSAYAGAPIFGIDVSEHNGTVDFVDVKNDDKEFVMIRLGYYNHIDKNFWQNVQKASSAKINFGVYLYSYAYSVAEAKIEANFVIETLKEIDSKGYGKYFTLPVAYDMEDKSQAKYGKAQLTKQMTTFCDMIDDACYVPMIYANLNWFNNYLDIKTVVSKGYKIWYANWVSGNPSFTDQREIGNTGVKADMWQYINGEGQSDGFDKNVIYNADDLVKCRHNYKQNSVTPATKEADGNVRNVCAWCNNVINAVIPRISSVSLSKTSYTYDGNQKNPSVIVKDRTGKTLKSGTDYTVSYAAGRTNVGTYNVKVTYKGNYSGTDTLSFKVIQQIPERCEPVLSKTSYTYDGNEKKPTVTIKDVVGNVLKEGTDYTLSYDEGRTDVGTYNVNITYKGNYSGTDKLSFTVIQQIPERCTPKLSETTYKYDGSEKTPTVTIVDVVNNVLEEGTDYTLTYDEGRTEPGTYNVKITYKGNYSGTDTLSYDIVDKSSASLTATLSKESYTYDGNEKNPTVTVKDSQGNTLVKGTDYTVTYDDDRTNVGTYNVTVTYIGEYSGTDVLSFKVIPQIPERCTPVLSKTSYTYDGNEKNPTVTIKDVVNNVLVNGTDYTLTYDADRTNVGTYNVTIAYKGNYSGTDTVSFKVIEQIPERCTPNLSETTYKYDGSEKTPTVTIIDVVNNVLEEGRDYTLTYDEGRTKPGTYNVKITYKGNYSGTATLSFYIVDTSSENLTATLSKTSYTYDGNEKNPTVTVKDSSGKTLVKGTDYTVTYDAGRTNVGTYNVKVTYIGKYSGTATLSFKVIQQIPERCTATLSATQTYYTGTVKTPGVSIKDVVGNVLKNGTDYTVTMDSGRKNVGRYAVVINYKGNYSGSQTLYFNIIPKGITGITKITSKSKGFTVQWATQQTATTGYQVQYSTSSSFSNATTITMPKNVYYAKSVTGLTGNKKYYVRIRTYTQTKFNGSNYNIYSPWCAVKSVVTGK